MSEPIDDPPLERALAPLRELLAISETGLEFTTGHFDRERYLRMRELVAELLRQPGSATPAFDPLAVFGSEKGYATPKVEVRGGVFRDGRILLVREHSDGLWTLPGGWCDVNDTPSESMIKEIREESGFDCRVVKLAALLDRRKHPHPPVWYHVYKLCFLCEITGGHAEPGLPETDAVDFFAEDALPPLSTPRVSPAQIQLLFQHERERNLPTSFD